MPGCLQRIQSSCASYVDRFPAHLPQMVARNIVTGVAIFAVTTDNSLNGMVTAGAVTALATVVEEAARPILQDVFGRNYFLAFAIQTTLVLVTARKAMDYFWGYPSPANAQVNDVYVVRI